MTAWTYDPEDNTHIRKQDGLMAIVFDWVLTDEAKWAVCASERGDTITLAEGKAKTIPAAKRAATAAMKRLAKERSR